MSNSTQKAYAVTFWRTPGTDDLPIYKAGVAAFSASEALKIAAQDFAWNGWTGEIDRVTIEPNK